jgi:hypothetical protein
MKMTNFGEFLEEFVCDLADRVRVSRFLLKSGEAKRRGRGNLRRCWMSVRVLAF